MSGTNVATTTTIISDPKEDVVVISDPGPGTGPGPKFTVSLSATLGSGEVEANVASTRWSQPEAVMSPM